MGKMATRPKTRYGDRFYSQQSFIHCLDILSFSDLSGGALLELARSPLTLARVFQNLWNPVIMVKMKTRLGLSWKKEAAAGV
jgi:hypothetical protein